MWWPFPRFGPRRRLSSALIGGLAKAPTESGLQQDRIRKRGGRPLLEAGYIAINNHEQDPCLWIRLRSGALAKFRPTSDLRVINSAWELPTLEPTLPLNGEARLVRFDDQGERDPRLLIWDGQKALDDEGSPVGGWHELALEAKEPPKASERILLKREVATDGFNCVVPFDERFERVVISYSYTGQTLRLGGTGHIGPWGVFANGTLASPAAASFIYGASELKADGDCFSPPGMGDGSGSGVITLQRLARDHGWSGIITGTHSNIQSRSAPVASRFSGLLSFTARLSTETVRNTLVLSSAKGQTGDYVISAVGFMEPG